MIGGSADVVSGYFDHCVNLAAKGQHLQAFVVYDRFPGFALVVSPQHNAEVKSIKDLANKKVGVSAPGSSTDFFLKYMLSKNGVDPNSVAVIGVVSGSYSGPTRVTAPIFQKAGIPETSRWLIVADEMAC